MFAQNATPGRQSILNQVVMELEHHLQSLARLVVDVVEGEALSEEEDNLKYDWNHDWHTLLLFQVRVDGRVCDGILDVLHKSEHYDKDRVNSSNDQVCNEAVQCSLMDLTHSIYLDDALVVGNVGAHDQKVDSEHEGGDLKHVDLPS